MYACRSLALLACLLVQHIFSFSKRSLFTFSTNSINNYYIYRFNYFAFLIARALVFRPPLSRSCALGCASVTAVVSCSQLCSCHRCRLVLSAVLLSPLSSCSLGCASVTAVVSALSRLCFVIASAISFVSLPQLRKSQLVASRCLCKSLTQSH